MSRTLAIVLLVAFAGLPQQALAAGWHVCNQTAEDLDIAIAYYDESNGWITKGWWRVNACGGCKFVMDHSRTDRTNVFLRAVTLKGEARIGGDAHFCVSDHAKGAPPWTGRSPKVCRGEYVSGGFQKHVIDTDKEFTTRITGKATGGRVCID